MQIYRRGSTGAEVSKIQARLSELGLYQGSIDGAFGGGTEAAVRAFQKASTLGIDGRVGPQTWAALFDGAAIEPPAILSKPLEYRCLALTGTFETNEPPPGCFAGVSGDFDGQGISFGVLQWNLGQRSLQPLLLEMDRRHPEILSQIFGPQLAELKQRLGLSKKEQLDWARSIQTPKSNLMEPWRGQFRALGRTPEFQDIEVKHATALFRKARKLAAAYELRSPRAVALLFDIKVQNGSISKAVDALIRADFNQLPAAASPADREVARMQIIANRRADVSKARWREDVRARKLTIANGEGTVHGSRIHLEEQFGITLDFAAAAEG